LQRRRIGDKNVMSPLRSPCLTSKSASNRTVLPATPPSSGCAAVRRSCIRRPRRSRTGPPLSARLSTARSPPKIQTRSRASSRAHRRSPSSSGGTHPFKARPRRRTGDGRERPHLDGRRAARRQERQGTLGATRDCPGGPRGVRGAAPHRGASALGDLHQRNWSSCVTTLRDALSAPKFHCNQSWNSLSTLPVVSRRSVALNGVTTMCAAAPGWFGTQSIRRRKMETAAGLNTRPRHGRSSWRSRGIVSTSSRTTRRA
jgi:hypothetical protein